MRKSGYIQTYTGDGKGKTTAAFGMLLRGVSENWKIYVVQFMKGDPLFDYGEIRACEKFKDVKIYQCRMDAALIIKMLQGDADAKKECSQKARYAWSRCVNEILNNEYDLVLMDEILPVVDNNLLEISELIHFLKNKPDLLEVVLTGRMKNPELISNIRLVSDYCTKMDCLEHPFHKKCPNCGHIFIGEKASYIGCPYCLIELEQVFARKGIEF